MADYIYDITNVELDPNTYRNTDVESVNLRNVPWINNSMENAFYNCQKLTTVTNIEQNVSNFTRTFGECYNLVSIPNLPDICDSTLTNTFRNCKSLINAPSLPANSTNITGTMEYTFLGCTNLVNTPIIPDWVDTMLGTFSECSSLVNAPTIPNSVTSMDSTFSYCIKLSNVPTIPNSVTNLARCFVACRNITNIPQLPNSINDLTSTFSACTGLTDVTSIPDSVVGLVDTFRSCTNLVNIPEIHHSITNLFGTFQNCTNLTGNIYINSFGITDVTNTFENTSLQKNVYIPFYNLYTNRENSITRNTFVEASYDEIGTKEGVYLKNLTPTFSISTTPADASVYMEVDGVQYSSSTLSVPRNTTVSWTVMAIDYVSETGTQVITDEDVDIQVTLHGISYIFTVIPKPDGATVKLESPGVTTVEGIGTQSIEVEDGSTVTYTVSKIGYVTNTHDIVINYDNSMEVTLEQEYTFGINEDYEATLLTYKNNDATSMVIPDVVYGEPLALLRIYPVPEDATVVLVASGFNQRQNEIAVIPGTEVTYTVSHEDYNPTTQDIVVNYNTMLDVVLDSPRDAGLIDDEVISTDDAGAVSDSNIEETTDAGMIENEEE